MLKALGFAPAIREGEGGRRGREKEEERKRKREERREMEVVLGMVRA